MHNQEPHKREGMSVWFAQYSQKMGFEDEGRTLVLPDGRRLPFPCDGYVVRFPGKVNTVVSLQGMPFSPEVMGNVASRFLTSGSGKFPSRLVREGPSEGPARRLLSPLAVAPAEAAAPPLFCAGRAGTAPAFSG